jgi:hypothetical protein
MMGGTSGGMAASSTAKSSIWQLCSHDLRPLLILNCQLPLALVPNAAWKTSKRAHKIRTHLLALSIRPKSIPKMSKNSVECKVESQQHALLVRNRKNHCGRRPLAIHSFDIQSPLLKRALEYVFDGITPGLGHLSFAPPFKDFFHRWERLQEMAVDEDNKDQETRAHVQLLKKVLEGELEETFDTHNDLLSHGVMKFEFLWTLFKPGDLIFTNQGGQDRVEKVQGSDFYSNPAWSCV